MEQEQTAPAGDNGQEAPANGTAVTTTDQQPRRDKAQLQAHEGGVLPILPRNIEEAQRYATGLIQANIVPDAFRYSESEARDLGHPNLKGQANASLVLMGVLKSMELGVAPQTGLSGLLPLRGRFTVWGDLAAALVQRTGQVANQTVAWQGPAFDEGNPLGEWPDDYTCEVRYWRVGQKEPYIGRFSVRDAKRAKLWMNSRKQPWIDYPKRMLFNRARALALRDGFSDGLHGLSLAEEIIDLPEEEAPAAVAVDTSALRADDEALSPPAEPEAEAKGPAE